MVAHIKLALSLSLLGSAAAVQAIETTVLGEYVVECWPTPSPSGAGVVMEAPCDGQAAVAACDYASTYCGYSMIVSVWDGCGVTCREPA